jgi:hypothetical protein
MWKIVYSADKRLATNLEHCLTDEGILVKLRPESKDPESNEILYQVLVPEADIDQANKVIREGNF